MKGGDLSPAFRDWIRECVRVGKGEGQGGELGLGRSFISFSTVY